MGHIRLWMLFASPLWPKQKLNNVIKKVVSSKFKPPVPWTLKKVKHQIRVYSGSPVDLNLTLSLHLFLLKTPVKKIVIELEISWMLKQVGCHNLKYHTLLQITVLYFVKEPARMNLCSLFINRVTVLSTVVVAPIICLKVDQITTSFVSLLV